MAPAIGWSPPGCAVSEDASPAGRQHGQSSQSNLSSGGSGDPWGCDDDALALQMINRARARAWMGGDAQRSLRAEAPAADGVAAWDAPRRRGPDPQEDEDRGPGLPPGRDRPGPTHYDPRPGKRDLDRVFTERGWAGKLAMAHIAVRWERIVGAQVAEHAEVVSFEVGRLELRASSSAWAQQLRLLMPTIEAAVERELASIAGLGDQPRVQIRVMGPSAPSWKHGRFGAARGGRGPRDTYG